MTRTNFPKQVTPAMARTRRPQGKALMGSTSGSYKAPGKSRGAPARKERKGC
jgi:hypothetical protein